MSNSSSRPSIDGFTLRRRGQETVRVLGQEQGKKTPHLPPAQVIRPAMPEAVHKHPAVASVPDILPRPQANKDSGLQRMDINESLKAIDDVPAKKPKKKKKWFLKKSVIASFIVVALLLGGGVYFFGKIMALSGRVFNGGTVFDLLGAGTKLKQDSNGWTHVLVFGTSEDDPGHDGANLTDSIMVISINQEKKQAAMTSMPRDMWVAYDNGCVFGYSGKINAVYECAGATNGDISKIDVVKGATALQKKVGEVFGLDVQYYVKVDYAVVRDLTTALGGVTVTIDSSDPRGIYDAGMGKLLKLPNGPATLQGEQALAFVRARGESGGSYGFNNNFSREQNQQKMILAIQSKALSTGTLTNPVAVSKMLDSLGDNIRTDFSTSEVKTLANLGKDISGDKVTHISLIDEKHPVVTTGMYNGQSIVRPIAGIDDFSKIQSYIQGKLSGGSIEDEDATISVLNGSGRAGAAAAQQTKLTQAGLTNTTIGDTAYRVGSALVWYDLTGGAKPKTQAKLASVLGQQPTGTKLPAGMQSTADFVIIVGNGTN